MAEAEKWEIDPAHTTVEFAVKHMMFTTVRGRFKNVRGTITANRERPEEASVDVEIEAASIDTGVAERDVHLRSGDFLDVERHPRLTFKSKRTEGALGRPGAQFRIIGDLTIRGMTMEIVLKATYLGSGRDPWGKERAGFSARSELDRREWGLQWNQALETGGVLVGHNVKIEVEAQAIAG